MVGSADPVVTFNLPGGATGSPAAIADGDGTGASDDTVLDDPDASGRRPIRWAKLSGGVTESTYARIMALGIQGIYGNRVYRRDYPDNSLAAQVIGWVNHDEKPVAGLEAYANFYLRGENGWVETEKDGHRHELAQFRSRDVPAANGYTVELSLDANVQQIVEAELARIARTYRPKKATIIVSDPRTGFILALANYPSFNPNDYNRLPPAQRGAMRDMALTDEYEPGSVFKIVVASAALNEGLVTPATTFDCTLETVNYHGRVLKLPHEASGDHFTRETTVAEIIAHSSNRGAAQLGMMLGADRFYRYCRAFGFGRPTGFPIAGEKEIHGDLKPPSRWNPIDITRIPMGQSVAVTPMQIHQAMCVVANGGLLMRPQVIQEVRDASGAVVYRFGPAVVRRVIQPATARTMARLLMGVTEDGTGRMAEIPGYEVAGKTGTAQILEPVTLASGKTVLRYSFTHWVTSFVGFFPANNPQIAISVIVNDPHALPHEGPVAGGNVAGPAFKAVAEQLIAYTHLDIHQPSLPGPAVRTLAMGGGGL